MGNEAFDHQRFVTWHEVLFEGGGASAVRRLLELPEETITLTFVVMMARVRVQLTNRLSSR